MTDDPGCAVPPTRRLVGHPRVERGVSGFQNRRISVFLMPGDDRTTVLPLTARTSPDSVHAPRRTGGPFVTVRVSHVHSHSYHRSCIPCSCQVVPVPFPTLRGQARVVGVEPTSAGLEPAVRSTGPDPPVYQDQPTRSGPVCNRVSHSSSLSSRFVVLFACDSTVPS